LGDEIEKNKVDSACNTYGGEEWRIHDFCWETRKIEITWKAQA